MTVAVLIPAKAKSRRIPNKNLQQVGDTSLVERCVKKVVDCRNVDRIVLDTDSDRIKELCTALDDGSGRLEIRERETELLGDDVGTPQICKKLLEDEPDIDMLGIMHSTAPFLQKSTLEKCIDLFLASANEYDSLFTVEPLHDYLWKDKPLNFNVDCRTGTDQVDLYYKLTGGFFISSREYIVRNEAFIGRNPVLYPVSVLESLDINQPNELELARVIEAGLKQMNYGVEDFEG